MRFKMDFSKLPKCGSLPKKNSSRIHPCKHIALQNGRCYYHQGRPITHGKYAQSTVESKRNSRLFISSMRQSMESLAELVYE
ncbi:MAG: hypothetical protein NTZ68_04245 [Candidatus Dependentiae bacterium]|nr:hypothetical protein [Candidatus Dependentiae bacterium]